MPKRVVAIIEGPDRSHRIRPELMDDETAAKEYAHALADIPVAPWEGRSLLIGRGTGVPADRVIALDLEEIVSCRRYAIDDREHGVAERVRGQGHWIRGERRDQTEPRSSETIYWRPAGHGRPWVVVDLPDEVDDDAAAWAVLETRLGLDEKYRWESLPLNALG